MEPAGAGNIADRGVRPLLMGKRSVIRCDSGAFFDTVGEMEFDELAFNVLMLAALLLTGFVGLFLIARL
jgi:hypothetical protein